MKHLAVALIVPLTFAIGCDSDHPIVVPNSRLTTANFDAIHNGMTTTDVVQLLGRWTDRPTDTSVKINGADTHVNQAKWKRDGREIVVNFVNDKVVSKSSQGLQ
jgi:hypothetical protein